MGFSLKKIAKAVVKPVLKIAAAPITVPLAAVNKVGLSEEVKSLTTVDTKNLTNVINNSTSLKGSTGSDEFKTAMFDTAKLGVAAAGGAGAISGTAATGGVLLAGKAQAGGGISLGDLGGLAGLPTDIGGIDLGNFNVVKPKTTSPISELFPDFLQPTYSGGVSNSGSNSNLILIVLAVIAFIGMIFLLIRKRL